MHYVTICLAKVYKIKIPNESHICLLKGHITYFITIHKHQAVLGACVPQWAREPCLGLRAYPPLPGHAESYWDQALAKMPRMYFRGQPLNMVVKKLGENRNPALVCSPVKCLCPGPCLKRKRPACCQPPGLHSLVTEHSMQQVLRKQRWRSFAWWLTLIECLLSVRLWQGVVHTRSFEPPQITLWVEGRDSVVDPTWKIGKLSLSLNSMLLVVQLLSGRGGFPI